MLTRSDFPYTGWCDECHQLADLCERNGEYICYVCAIHQGSLPMVPPGVHIVVTEVRA